MREIKQMKFINDHLDRIVKMGIENEKKIGYLQLTADENFQILNNKIKFVEGDFPKKDYQSVHRPEPFDPKKVVKVLNVYYRVLWWDNKTIWHVKEVIIMEIRFQKSSPAFP